MERDEFEELLHQEMEAVAEQTSKEDEADEEAEESMMGEKVSTRECHKIYGRNGSEV